MLKYNKWILIFSLIFALIFTFWTEKQIASRVQESSPKPVITVPIASVDIEPMTAIESSQVTYVEIDKESIGKFSILTNDSDIIGRIALNRIEKNSPFISGALYNEDDAPFPIPPGYRAITIENTPLVSVGGYVKAGMYVDIIWTYDDQGVKKTSFGLQNVKVLAIGPPSSQIGLAAPKDASTVTLLVSTLDAQRLTYMTQTGEIKLLLRPSPTENKIRFTPSELSNVLPMGGEH